MSDTIVPESFPRRISVKTFQIALPLRFRAILLAGCFETAGRGGFAAANWLPIAMPTTSGLMPSVECRCSTGNGRPMARNPTNIAGVIGSIWRKTFCTVGAAAGAEGE